MRLIENSYVKIVMFLILVLIAVSFTSVNNAILESTGMVTDSTSNEKLLFDCGFEDTFICRNGEMPVKSEGVTFVDGKIGKGILVDETDYLEYLALNNFESGEGTIELWVNPNWDSSGEGAHTFFYTRNAGWSFYIGTAEFNYRLYFKTGYGTVNYEIHDWVPGKWHHITTTWDRLETKLYIDGVYQAKDKYYPPANSPGRIYIGSGDLQTNQAEAVIDDVKIYNYAKSPEEITADYDSSIKESKATPEATPTPEVKPVETTPATETEEEKTTVETNIEYIGTGEETQPEAKKDNKLNILLIIVCFLVLLIIYLVMQLRKKKSPS